MPSLLIKHNISQWPENAPLAGQQKCHPTKYVITTHADPIAIPVKWKCVKGLYNTLLLIFQTPLAYEREPFITCYIAFSGVYDDKRMIIIRLVMGIIKVAPRDGHYKS